MATIAVDFDGCLCEFKWPDIGKPNQPIINRLVSRQAEGDKLILWTCREGKMLDDAILWALNHGLHFDAINDNLPGHVEKYGDNCRKVFADEYWDDKSVVIRAGENPMIMNAHSIVRWVRTAVTIEKIPFMERLKRRWHKWRCA